MSARTTVRLHCLVEFKYIADVVIGGQRGPFYTSDTALYSRRKIAFTVQIDTGSTDLWVLPANPQSVQLTQTTNIPLVESYGIGQANGTIEFAEVEFSGFTIPSQGNVRASRDYSQD